MECWFDLERHLDAEIIGLQVAMYIIGPVLKKIVTNSRTGKTRKLSREETDDLNRRPSVRTHANESDISEQNNLRN